MKRSIPLLVAIVLLHGAVSASGAPSSASRRRVRHVPRVRLVWHAETLDGRVVTSNNATVPVNPASVVKVATSLWTLERLGPDFRFETRFYARGRIDSATGTLHGDLVVQGSGDPDFQYDNAFLVAAALNRLGVRRVTGALVVNRAFWIGFENGSEGTEPDPVVRGTKMAQRLRQALDPRRWDGRIRWSWREYAQRRGVAPAAPPRIVVAHGVGVDGEHELGSLLFVHRSEPVRDVLRRYNCFSNNDVERLGATLGPVSDLVEMLDGRLAAAPGSIELETASGLGTNRLSPMLIVRLMRELRATCARLGVDLESVLPVAGCDEGTVTRFFPLLSTGSAATAVVGKTGTLTNTDGGVSILAGIARTVAGDVIFCVAAPEAGGRLKAARVAEERWVLDLLAREGGPRPRQCSAELPTSDQAAAVIMVAEPQTTARATAGTASPQALRSAR